MSRGALLLYCQHSLGLGHLVRSFALAEALAEHFRVTMLSGGVVPAWLHVPAGVDVVPLPPLGADGEGQLVSRDPRLEVGEAVAARKHLVLEAFEGCDPDVVLIELFPFGRKKFAGELLPLLRAAHARPAPPVVACSLRDILVGSRRDQERHDERASRLANRYFDVVLVHSDPRLARLEESFRPRTPMRVPVRYTGFVASRRPPVGSDRNGGPVVVSAGGGLVGAPLLRAAIDAHRLGWEATGTQTTIVAGPFLPDSDWRSLQRLARGAEGLKLRRSVPDLRALLAAASASVSQCGYNTALDLLETRVPALVVPFAEGREDEQLRRARRLERLGALRVLEPSLLDGAALAAALAELRSFRPRTVSLDVDGAAATVSALDELVQLRASRTLRGAA